MEAIIGPESGEKRVEPSTNAPLGLGGFFDTVPNLTRRGDWD